MNNQQILDYLKQNGAELNAEGDVVLPTPVAQDWLALAQDAHAVLTQYALLKIHGDDAESFLQGQFSSDVKALDGSTTQWSSYSNAKGRMQASFLLWQSASAFFLIIRRDIAEAFRRRLAMFVMRAKVKVEIVDGVILGEYRQQAEPDVASYQPVLSEANDSRMVVTIGGKIRLTCLLADEVALPVLSGSLIDSLRFDLCFINAGIPWVSLATYEAFVPQMANLDLIGGISFRKGCYPGQEIVARTQYLGKVKRRMFIVESIGGACPVGADVRVAATGEQAIGKVVLSVALGAEKYRALVVMQISAWEGQPYLALEPQVLLSRVAAPYSIPELQEA